jgi:hypothetical protein
MSDEHATFFYPADGQSLFILGNLANPQGQICLMRQCSRRSETFSTRRSTLRHTELSARKNKGRRDSDDSSAVLAYPLTYPKASWLHVTSNKDLMGLKMSIKPKVRVSMLEERPSIPRMSAA